MRVFLSYAEEDREIASRITDWFDENDVEVYNWLDHNQRGLRFIHRIQREIPRADYFLALLSPRFIESDWCQREVELALHHEQALQRRDPAPTFIQVLETHQTPRTDAGFLSGYDWLDFTEPENVEAAVRELAERLEDRLRRGLTRPARRSRPASQATRREQPAPQKGSSLFRNREDELEKVLRGLTTGGGSHFWLVVAPPQLGKTWFLERLSDDRTLEDGRWITRQVDLRAEPAGVRHDAGALVARLFGQAAPVTIEEDTLRAIARAILSAGRPHLCLLDSAELLDEETASKLRACLTRIYHLVQVGMSDVRLAVIVASRRDDAWKGVTPYPRLSPLPLAEFKSDVVQQAMHDLAHEMGRHHYPADVRRNSALVHRLTEGLPALLVSCLEWIRGEQWLGMERLESQELFEELADPYVQEELLTRASLFPGGRGDTGDVLDVLESTYRILVPYRLFTQSHLRYYLERDPDFKSALGNLGWSMADLWRAISGTELLSRPLNEPWQEIHAAIRRLLYRYFYRTDEQRAAAHNEAREFVKIWAEKQVGTEQVVGLVECLWHEAIVRGLGEPAEMEHSLTESARELSLALRPSPAYTVEELRAYAAQRMRNDEELEETVGTAEGLFNRLVEVVLRP